MSSLPILYALPQVAEYLGISVRTVKRLIASGKLVGTRYARATRVLEENLNAFTRGATCQTNAIEPANSSSSNAANKGSTKSAGTNPPLDRSLVLRLAQQTSKRRARPYTDTCSSTSSPSTEPTPSSQP